MCLDRCQFGSPNELLRIKNQRDYRDGLTALQDWRNATVLSEPGGWGRTAGSS